MGLLLEVLKKLIWKGQKMREIILKGTSYQRGCQHGAAFAGEIRRFFDLLINLGVKRNEKSRAILHRILKNVEEPFPELREEMGGIAEGSGMLLDDILLLSFYPVFGALTSECTNLGLINEKQGAIHGKTGDSEDFLDPFYLLETVYPDKGASFINICMVGTIWTEAGLNSSGLSCGQSSGPTISNQDGRGFPCMVMPYPMLKNCATVAEAIAFLARFRMSGKGLNIFLSDSKGDTAVIEKSYDNQAARKAKEGVLWNTNHFIEGELAGYNFTRGKRLAESEARYNYLKKRLEEEKVPHTVDEMKNILKNHEKPGAGAICRHSNGDNARTHFGAIFIPKERRALIAHGNPCENEFIEYKII